LVIDEGCIIGVNEYKWHFINVKFDNETEKRRLFRRISISQEEKLRTASERIACLDLGKTVKTARWTLNL